MKGGCILGSVFGASWDYPNIELGAFLSGNFDALKIRLMRKFALQIKTSLVSSLNFHWNCYKEGFVTQRFFVRAL